MSPREVPEDMLPIRGLLYGLLFSVLLFWLPIGIVTWTILR
jgi:hypothetical protein